MNYRKTLCALILGLGFAPAVHADALDDADVRDAIEQEILLDRVVPTDEVDVEVDAGIATLTGEVGNLLAKERVVRIAETVKGVRAVVDRLEIDPAHAPSDIELQQAVDAALLSDPATDSYEVEVAVHDGHVVLTGTVDSWQERQLCATVAKGVDGVLDLTNEVDVSYATTRTDSEIEHEVEEALRWNVLVDDALVGVAVSDGDVRLTGTVGSAAEKTQAVADAYVAGVRTVDATALQVARWARDDDLRQDKYVYKAPEAVERAVEAALAIDPRVHAFNVDTSANLGVVTLRGVVDNLKAKRAAEQDARHTVGVSSVRNHLKVRPAEERADDAIAQDVRATLLRDPYVERYEIEVDADDGRVRLTGEVDSYFEKGQADDLAARVDGVTEVDNDLVVEDQPFAYDPYVDAWSMYAYPWYGYFPASTFATDWEIRRNIEDELFWSPFVDADEVAVSVEDGVATLTGTVDSAMEKGAARDNAFDGGATRVRNRLRVSPTESDPASVQ